MTEKINFEAYMHAYVDGQLTRQQQELLQKYLASHPDKMHELRQYSLINQGLHSLFDPVSNREIPDRVKRLLAPSPDKSAPANHAVKKNRLFGWAVNTLAAGFLLLIGGLAGWFAGTTGISPGKLQPLQQLALDAHRIYALEQRHAVEVNASEKDHLMKWLSERLGSDVGPADFNYHGFELMGGRLLPALGRRAGAYFYKNDRDERVTLYISFKPETEGQKKPDCIITDSRHTLCRWVSDKQSYFLIGDLSVESLRLMAENAIRQADSEN